MDRTRLLYSAVLAGAACLALEVATGLILWFAVPSGHGPRFRGRGAEHSFIGIDRSTWIDLHDWVGLLLAAVIVVHVALNWGWVMKQTRLVLAESAGRPIVPPPEEGDQKRQRRAVSARQGAGAMAMGRPRVAVRHAGQKKAARAAPRATVSRSNTPGPRALAVWRASRAFSNPRRQDGQHREGDPFSLADAKASYGVGSDASCF